MKRKRFGSTIFVKVYSRNSVVEFWLGLVLNECVISINGVNTERMGKRILIKKNLLEYPRSNQVFDCVYY